MCGRIACALGIDDLSCATACKSKHCNVYIKTNTHKSTAGTQASYNVPPTASVPVLVSAQHECFQNKNDQTKSISATDSDRLLVSMRFGIIPHWLKTDNVKSFNHETHLCKLERIRESKLYNPLYKKGYRCAIPCVGYYEWQATKSNTNKQPYFFYNKNNSPSDLTSNKGSFEPESGWNGIQLLYLAGIFSTYTNYEGKMAYSFAIITKEASENWLWVHHRMPIVLQSEENVCNWIQYNIAPSSSAPLFRILETPITNLAAHPVDKTLVNKTKNNLPSCIVPIDLNKPTNNLMTSWLLNANSITIDSDKKELTKNTKKRASLDSWITVKKKMKKE